MLIKNLSARFKQFSLALLISIGLVGCSTEFANSLFTGEWSGIASFGASFTSSMDLVQKGSSVTGTMSMSGNFIDKPLTGQVDGSGRMTWTVNISSKCQEWSGILEIQASSELEGPIDSDQTSCNDDRPASGTLKLSKK